MIKYLTMFTRDYFQHLLLALEKQLPFEVKQPNERKPS